MIVNVSNFSLYGDAISSTTIYCYTPKTILFGNSKNISLKYLKIKNCHHEYTYSGLKHLTKSLSTLCLFNSSDFIIQNSVFECDYQQCGLVVFDAMGNSNLINNIKSGQLLLVHNHTTSDINIEINYYEQCGCCTNDTALKIIAHEHSYKIKLNLSHIKLNLDKPVIIYCSVAKVKMI